MNIEYTIIMSHAIHMSDALYNLQLLVEDYIKEEWRPIGGVCMATNQDICYATQSMIRES